MIGNGLVLFGNRLARFGNGLMFFGADVRLLFLDAILCGEQQVAISFSITTRS